MTNKLPSYLLHVGNADRERLEILAELYNPSSQAFLQMHAPALARSILDIGCGHGQMTLWLARQWQDGTAVGIDISEEQLDICEAGKKQQAIANAEFLRHDMTSGPARFAPFDMAYCRFLLMHVKNWDCLFQHVLASCRSGGAIVIEEPAFPFFCYPESASLKRANALGTLLTTQAGLNFDCIAPLWRYVQDLDVDICTVKFSQPALTTVREKSLLWRSFHQIKAPLLATGLASEAEIDDIITDLEALAHDPQCLVGGLRVIQLHLRKR